MFQTTRPTLAALSLAALLALSGCAGLDAGRDLVSGITDSLFGDDDNTDPPATLQDYPAELKLEIVWKESVGDGADQKFLKLIPAVQDGKVQIAAGITADQVGRLKAGELVNFVAQQVGGKGGGKPDMAMAGGTDAVALPKALASVQAWVTERV